VLRLFEIQSVLTLAERPQANALAERNGGEVMRHLRALILNKVLRLLWSVMLPLVMRIINRSYKPSVGAVPHRLIHWAPTDLDRGLFAPFRETIEVPAMESPYVRSLEMGYEVLLDATSEFILQEQAVLAAKYEVVVPTAFEAGTLVLVSYLVRPPTTLHCSWSGPYEIMSRVRNTAILRDLTSGTLDEYDVSRLRIFLVTPSSDIRQLAAADLGEAEVLEVIGHRGSAKKRTEMEFEVRWSDGDLFWEP
jgi:hypothetical protein